MEIGLWPAFAFMVERTYPGSWERKGVWMEDFAIPFAFFSANLRL